MINVELIERMRLAVVELHAIREVILGTPEFMGKSEPGHLCLVAEELFGKMCVASHLECDRWLHK